MDDPNQDPVYVKNQSQVAFEAQSTLKSNHPSGEKIVKMKLPDARTSESGFVALESLSLEEVCYLLDHTQLSIITSVAREYGFSGRFQSFFLSTFACDNVKLEHPRPYNIKQATF